MLESAIKISEERTQKIIDILCESGAYIACGYGERGYTTENGVILFNWNDCSQRLVKYLESAGYACAWLDEWIICNNGKAWRTTSNGHGWQSSYTYTNDGDIITREDEASMWIEAVIDNPRKCLPYFIDVESDGFVKFEDEQETGLHAGQDASPRDTYKRAKAVGYAYVIFKMVDSGMFDCTWQCYVKNEEE